MKRLLVLWIAAVFLLGAVIASCNDADDADDDDAGDSGDDDSLGAGEAAQQCLDDLQSPFNACKAQCPDPADLCGYYHCVYGCLSEMFAGAVACANLYPELADMNPYWACNVECDNAFIQCVEPLDQCTQDLCAQCLDAETNCEHNCPPPAE
jgi:hypothetical protein